MKEEIKRLKTQLGFVESHVICDEVSEYKSELEIVVQKPEEQDSPSGINNMSDPIKKIKLLYIRNLQL